jgi:hypothetical protein
MTNAKLRKLVNHVTADVKRRAEIDIADIKAAIPYKIEDEMVSWLQLEDELNSDEVNLKRVREVMRR